MGQQIRHAPIAGLAAALFIVAANAQDDQYSFMPAGGRTLLLELVGKGTGEALADVVARNRSAEEWRAWAAAKDAALDDTALATFVGYAELNLPVSEDVRSKIARGEDGSLLPADGKDLAIAQCQFCHSLFSGYLMHDRDEVGWKGTFKSPFHSEIPMSEAERDTFARYSALNMPVRMEDVPPELRF